MILEKVQGMQQYKLQPILKRGDHNAKHVRDTKNKDQHMTQLTKPHEFKTTSAGIYHNEQLWSFITANS